MGGSGSVGLVLGGQPRRALVSRQCDGSSVIFPPLDRWTFDGMLDTLT